MKIIKAVFFVITLVIGTPIAAACGAPVGFFVGLTKFPTELSKAFYGIKNK